VEINKYSYFTHLQFSKLYLIAKQFIADQLQISSALLRGNVKVITIIQRQSFIITDLLNITIKYLL